MGTISDAQVCHQFRVHAQQNATSEMCGRSAMGRRREERKQGAMMLLAGLMMATVGLKACPDFTSTDSTQRVINRAIEMLELVPLLPPLAGHSFLPDLDIKIRTTGSSAGIVVDRETQVGRAHRNQSEIEVWVNLTWRFLKLHRTGRRDFRREELIRQRLRHQVGHDIGKLYERWVHRNHLSMEAQKIRTLLDAYTDFWFSTDGPGAEAERCG